MADFFTRNGKIIDELNDIKINISLGSCFYISLDLLINNDKIIHTTKIDFRFSKDLDDLHFKFFKNMVKPFQSAFYNIHNKMCNIYQRDYDIVLPVY